MKKSVTKAREKFINSSTRSEFFEVHDDKYYYTDNYMCLALPIIESTIPVTDSGNNHIAPILHQAAKNCRRPLDLPTLAQLKNYRKTWAAFNKSNGIKLPKSHFVYQWTDGIALKLDFLILIMEMIPDLVLMAEKANCIIYGYSNSCGAEIAICPVKVAKDHWKVTDIHSFDEWTAPAPEDQTPAEPAAPAPAPADSERPKAKRRAAPEWLGKTLTAYPKKPKQPEWIGRKMIITIGERYARPAEA